MCKVPEWKYVFNFEYEPRSGNLNIDLHDKSMFYVLGTSQSTLHGNSDISHTQPATSEGSNSSVSLPIVIVFCLHKNYSHSSWCEVPFNCRFDVFLMSITVNHIFMKTSFQFFSCSLLKLSWNKIQV